MKITKQQALILQAHSQLTRRDFIGAGVLAATSFALPPQFFKATANAQGDSKLPPFLVFDLKGGAALAANFLVGAEGGSKDLLPSYSQLGFDPRKAKMDERFGLPAPQGVSRFFEGMTSKMSPAAQAGFQLVAIVHGSQDDTDINQTSALGHIGKYLTHKNSFTEGLGVDGTSSGGRTRLGYDSGSLRPQHLASVEQLLSLTGLPELEKSGLSESDVVSLSKDYSAYILKELKKLVGPNEKLASQLRKIAIQPGSFNPDPRKNAAAAKAFGLNAQTESEARNAIFGGIALNCIAGLVGPSCIAIEGFDYHDSTQTTGDAADFMAGEYVGQTIELASQMKSPLMVQIISDGSCSPKEGSRVWISDSGERSITLLGFFDPTKKPKAIRTQLGSFTKDGQISKSHRFIGTQTAKVADVVLVNYLSAIGKTGDVRSVLAEGQLPTNMIDELVLFT